MLAALLLNPRRVGGDDAPKKKREYLTRGELYQLELNAQAEAERLARLAKDAEEKLRIETDRQLKLEIIEEERRYADKVRRDNEALILIFNEELKRRIIKAWF